MPTVIRSWRGGEKARRREGEAEKEEGAESYLKKNMKNTRVRYVRCGLHLVFEPGFCTYHPYTNSPCVFLPANPVEGFLYDDLDHQLRSRSCLHDFGLI